MEECSNKYIGRMLALYEFGALEDSERQKFLDHLINCAYCHNQVYSIEPAMVAFRDHRLAAKESHSHPEPERVALPAGVQSASSRRRTQWWSGLWWPVPIFALLLAVLTAGLLYWSVLRADGNGERSVQNGAGATSVSVAAVVQSIEVPKALYIPPTEGVVLRSPSKKAFERAMAAYQQDDLEGAVERLSTLGDIEPDQPGVNFYLGVSLLLIGKPGEAIAPLRLEVQGSAGPQLENSRFYLALAYLKHNQIASALEELDRVIEVDGEHRFAAEKIKLRVADVSR